MNTITPEMYRAVEQQRDEALAKIAKYEEAIDVLSKKASLGLVIYPNSNADIAVKIALSYIESHVR